LKIENENLPNLGGFSIKENKSPHREFGGDFFNTKVFI